MPGITAIVARPRGPRTRPRCAGKSSTARANRRAGSLLAGVVMLATVAFPALAAGGSSRADPAARNQPQHAASRQADLGRAPGTVWLCRPGMPDDPCAASLTTTVAGPSGSISVTRAQDDTASKFDCFYVYPTVSTEETPNADSRVEKTEVEAAIAQASRFSTVCHVWAPIYRQITLSRLFALPLLNATSAATVTAYKSLKAGFEDYLKHDSDGRPIIFIGHSQGAAMLIMLLQHVVDHDPDLLRRLVLAIILGGNVVVPAGAPSGGSFSHIAACSSPGETGCVIAYSSFPGQPPATSFFGRPGQGVSLVAGQTSRRGLSVLCVNPAAIGGQSATLEPFFPSEGTRPTPWVEFPHLYAARCRSAGGATWLQVTKISGPSDKRPAVTATDGPDWGYHDYDVNLALGNLLADTAAAEATWQKGTRR